MKQARKMTKADALAWKARYELVNALELEELRTTPPEIKLQQLASLFAMALGMGWDKQLEAEKAMVRDRWIRWRRMYRER